MLAAICICVLDWSRCRAKEAICMRIIVHDYYYANGALVYSELFPGKRYMAAKRMRLYL